MGDEESSVDINEQDQETSPASGSEADIQRSNTDHHDQMRKTCQSLKAWIEAETKGHGEEDNEESSAYDVLMRGIGASEWKKAESNRFLGYIGLSSRSKR